MPSLRLVQVALTLLLLGVLATGGCAAPSPTGQSASTPTTGIRVGGGNTPAAAEVARAAQSPTTGSGISPVTVTALTGATRNVTVPIVGLNGSNINGSATLTAIDAGRSRVQILATGSTDAHPAEFHDGRCASFDSAPRWSLQPVQNGASTSELDVPFEQLARGGTAIVLHRSPQDETPVACGNVEPMS